VVSVDAEAPLLLTTPVTGVPVYTPTPGPPTPVNTPTNIPTLTSTPTVKPTPLPPIVTPTSMGGESNIHKIYLPLIVRMQ
jgi:hypothetical protein